MGSLFCVNVRIRRLFHNLQKTMGWFSKLHLIIVSIIVAVVYKSYYDISKPVDAPKPDLDKYWGPGDKKLYIENPSIRKFEISYSNGTIEKLRSRLNDAPGFHLPLEGTNFEYGFNSNKLQEIIKYWRTTYLDNWSKKQKYFNQFPHFKTQIQGLDIHFIHVKPKVDEDTTVLPVILLHGWPGSVREFYEMIPKLTSTIQIKKMKIAFEVVVPSLPGYGWSQASSKTGMNPMEISVIMNHLMKRLGHNQYYAQGGDWGSLVANLMATLFPQNVMGIHLNMCGINTPWAMIKMFVTNLYPKLFTDEKYVNYYYPLGQNFKDLVEETGYMHIQATKPDTIGTVLSDTPIGLAAYIIEKFSTWTNKAYRNLPDGGLDKYFTLDSLLDNVMVYYLTNSILTSQRLYSEAFNTKMMESKIDRVQTSVPCACAKFRYELLNQPDFILRDKYVALIQSNHFEDGGHFAAMQLPEILYKDFVEFVGKTL